jgi:hypothetical protein
MTISHFRDYHFAVCQKVAHVFGNAPPFSFGQAAFLARGWHFSNFLDKLNHYK